MVFAIICQAELNPPFLIFGPYGAPVSARAWN